MNRSDSVDQLVASMVKVLGKFEDVTKARTAKIKTKTGVDYSYTFADLKDVMAYVRPLLAADGLVVTQHAYSDDKGTCVATTIMHESGQWMEWPGLRLPAGADAQSHGSAITFARRYALMAVLGLATEDDDGASAQPKSAPKAATSSKASSAGGITDAQMKKMLATFTEKAITDRQQRLDYCSSVIGRELGSSKDLTRAEASQVIDALAKVPT